MFSELRSRVKKAGQPPGTAVYTGVETSTPPRLTAVSFDAHDFHETTATKLEDCIPAQPQSGTTWLQVAGLQNTALIEQIATHFQLHPLTLEDILNVNQRPKVEEFAQYLFITFRMLSWHQQTNSFSTEQISLVIGKNFLLSFQERETSLFNNIHERLRSGPTQRVRQQGSDYLAYRMIDNVVDQYFVVLEGLGDELEDLEELIITAPTESNSHLLYHLKRQILMIRKAIWPMREALSHLLQIDEEFISPFTRVYLRDAYDHAVQAIDTIETFRDMLAGILDIYLSSLSIRMNEVMKILTIIATIFIPITFIASVFGMNFKFMPELAWKWSYPIVLAIMLLISLIMLYYFRRKKWI